MPTTPPTTFPVADHAAGAPSEIASGEVVTRRTAFIAIAVLVAIANFAAAWPVYVPFVTPLIGFLAVVGVPTFLIYGANPAPWVRAGERLGLSMVATLLGLIAVALVTNTVLPLLGDNRPLTPGTILVVVDLVVVALAVWAHPRHPRRWLLRVPSLTGRSQFVIGYAVSLVVLSVMGAVRLNNGAGGGVATFMLAAAVVFMGVLVWSNKELDTGVVSVSLYCLGLALLFMTSLRGWHTTGHDVQQEMYVFLLTKAKARWSIAAFRSPYNACLSITILPNVLWAWARVSPPYIYKMFFQLLFAFCPVMVYQLALRAASKAVAMLASLFFVSFITFYQDMPMLNRQEIGFLFFTATLLVLFQDEESLRWRRWWFCAFALGMVVSHYSTTYMAIGAFVLARIAGYVVAWLAPRVRRRMKDASVADATAVRRRVITIPPLLFLAAASFFWTTPATHTNDRLSVAFSATLRDLTGGPNVRSTDTSSAVLNLQGASAAQVFRRYKESVEQVRADDPNAYYPSAALNRYPTPLVGQQELPITALGHRLQRLGIDVSSLLSKLHLVLGGLLQIFLVIGLVLILTRMLRGPTPTPLIVDVILLSMALTFILAAQVLLPALSLDYGVLRSFQQMLLVAGVVVVWGAQSFTPRRLRRAGTFLPTAALLIYFAVGSGLATQIVGGYPAQLYLNNSGPYYQHYYVSDEEIAGAQWVSQHTHAGRGPHSPDIQVDTYTANRMSSFSGLRTVGDIFPSLVKTNAWVFLPSSELSTGEANPSFDGYYLTYRYPVGFLDEEKDLMYNSGSARVYR